MPNRLTLWASQNNGSIKGKPQSLRQKCIENDGDRQREHWWENDRVAWSISSHISSTGITGWLAEYLWDLLPHCHLNYKAESHWQLSSSLQQKLSKIALLCQQILSHAKYVSRDNISLSLFGGYKSPRLFISCIQGSCEQSHTEEMGKVGIIERYG